MVLITLVMVMILTTNVLHIHIGGALPFTSARRSHAQFLNVAEPRTFSQVDPTKLSLQRISYQRTPVRIKLSLRAFFYQSC